MPELNFHHLEIARSGPEAIRAWRADVGKGVRLQLQHADLQGVDWTGVELEEVWALGADFSGAVFESADLSGACFRAANLSAITATRATLHQIAAEGANFTGAYLVEAHLCRASLWGAVFMNATLRGTNCRGARIGGTVFAGKTDLSEASHLEDVRHDMRSDVGTHALSASRGRVPEAFLRGCGLSEWQIEASRLDDEGLGPDARERIARRALQLRVGMPPQARDVLISYSHLDADFVDALEPLLRRERISSWRDVRDLKAGRMESQLRHQIDQGAIVLLVLSEHSVQSHWVEWEADQARNAEMNGDQDVLCPITLDAAWKTCRWSGPLRQQIQKYHIVDVSRWREPGVLEAVVQERLVPGLSTNYPGCGDQG